MLHSNRREKDSRPHKDELVFRFFRGLYAEMLEERSVDKLNALGGVRELAKALGTDLDLGIDTSANGEGRFSLVDRQGAFGTNAMQDIKPRASFPWTKALLKRQVLTPFVIAAMVTTALGLSFKEERENLGWIDNIEIWVVVFVFVLTSVLVDQHAFWMHGEMIRAKEVFDVMVIRNGNEQLIKNVELLVGDILVLTKHVIVAADGLLFVDNDLFIDESAVTGDSKPIKKKLLENPFCLSGTIVKDGGGKILVTALGNDSELGQTIRTMTDSTNFEENKTKKARSFFFWYNIGALCLGFVSFVALLIQWMVSKSGFPFDKISGDGPIQFLLLAVAIIVFEIQEGYVMLPLLNYAYFMWKLAKDKVFVNGSNVIGQLSDVTSICFDKTGTLTENMMTVQQGYFQGRFFYSLPTAKQLEQLTLKRIIENASLNSEAFFTSEEDGSINFVGNQTECALLVMIKKFGVDYSEVRLHNRAHIIKSYGFNSEKKMSSVVIKHGESLTLYNKGAAEMVLEKCLEYVDPSGSRNPISESKRFELQSRIVSMANRGLRTLALTYTDLDANDFSFSEDGEPIDECIGGKRGFLEEPAEDLVLLAIVGIEDPIREGVHEVVENFRRASVNVRMLTGDNLDTAKHVAHECGIYSVNGLAMEGAEFRRRLEEDVEGLKKDLPKLQVLARCSPSDKQEMVRILNSIGEVVAVSGDGTNDARALKESRVGIAMGTQSTNVAREVASVVILNNDFSTVLALYMWSCRFTLSLFGYMQFRASVSLVFWIVVLVAVCAGVETLLNVHQFLWANFVIDTLVVLAFATENPPARVPGGNRYDGNVLHKASLVLHIILQSLYHILVVICTFYSWSSLFEGYNEDDHDLIKMRKNSLMFNMLIFIVLFNSLNCRKVFNEYDIFEGLFDSPMSCAIRLVTIALQLLIMLTPVRTLFKVTELNAWEWLYSIGVSVVVIPFSTLIRYMLKSRKHTG